jgi:hypothetical protein
VNNIVVVTRTAFPLPHKGFIGFLECSRRRMYRLLQRCAPRIYLPVHGCFWGKPAFIHNEWRKIAQLGAKPGELFVFRGGVQATKHENKATQEVPVAATARHCA